jgi:hypothetical protein
MRTLKYGDLVRQMKRLKDAAMRQRSPLVQSEERAAWPDSPRRNLDQRGFILDYYSDVIHPASESRRDVEERSFRNLVEICCAHLVLIAKPVLLALLQRTTRQSISDSDYSGHIARKRALSGNAASQNPTAR